MSNIFPTLIVPSRGVPPRVLAEIVKWRCMAAGGVWAVSVVDDALVVQSATVRPMGERVGTYTRRAPVGDIIDDVRWTLGHLRVNAPGKPGT